MKLYPFPIVVIDEKTHSVRHSPRDGNPKLKVHSYGVDGRLHCGWWMPEGCLGGYWPNRIGKISGL